MRKQLTLRLSRETLRSLEQGLEGIVGGLTVTGICCQPTFSCDVCPSDNSCLPTRPPCPIC